MNFRLPCAVCTSLLMVPIVAAAVEPEDQAGRDFPKTLTFDEPGIDDEMSLPTLIVLPHGGAGDVAGAQVELDKRLTTRLSLQLNVGYTTLSRSDASSLTGWQNTEATLKYVLFGDRQAEQLVSFSLLREFGGSGARRIGAASAGSTAALLNFGQGFASLASSRLVKPFAITGVIGYQLPDTTGSSSMPQAALLSASLQYSFDVLMSGEGGTRMPRFLHSFLPIVECVFELPTTGREPREGSLAPGLIYAGHGYQLAAEALIPLTKSTGHQVGFIAQLNISLETFGIPALAQPVF